MHTGTIDEGRLTVEDETVCRVVGEGANSMFYREFTDLDVIELRIGR